MAEIKQPLPVKFFCGVLTRFPELFQEIEELLTKQFGPTDLKSNLFPFDFTDHYQASMGTDIKRQFFAFQELIPSDQISSIKVWTNQLEKTIAVKHQGKGIKRPVNLDPGYLSASKLVLATTKDYAHRVYLGQGIYAEVTLRYNTEGSYQSWSWTYPDYQTKEYMAFFQRMRQVYLTQI